MKRTIIRMKRVKKIKEIKKMMTEMREVVQKSWMLMM